MIGVVLRPVNILKATFSAVVHGVQFMRPNVRVTVKGERGRMNTLDLKEG